MCIYDDVAKETGICQEIRYAKELLTFRAGGVLNHVFSPKSTSEFCRIISALEQRGIAPFLLGGGSNVIAADGGIEAPVVLSENLNKIRIENGFAFAECGAKISNILRAARECSLGGLEFLAGVPLTLGGACRMNASAFGRQIFDLIEGVFVFSTRACSACGNAHTDLRILERKKCDINYGYRKGVDEVIVGAKLKLERISKDASIKMAKEFLMKRRAKQPRECSVGSVFKNAALPAGKLIEDSGLKGLQIGGAKISEIHANFIVNTGGATADDFITLVQIAEKEVKKKFNIQLEREFVLLE